MNNEYVCLVEAERLTGLPSSVLKALADSGELPLEIRGGEWFLGKSALLGWCRLYGRILSAVAARQPQKPLGVPLSARNLVWMSQAGLLAGKDRVRV